MEQLEQACAAGATRLLVDNQPPETVREWGRLARELSAGNRDRSDRWDHARATFGRTRRRADFISVGALTHSVQAADLALEVGSRVGGSRLRHA